MSLQCICKYKGKAWTCQKNFEKEKVRDHMLTDFKIYYKAVADKMSRSREQKTESRNRQNIERQLVFDKDTKGNSWIFWKKLNK